jgi:nitrite reductase (NO-forming)
VNKILITTITGVFLTSLILSLIFLNQFDVFNLETRDTGITKKVTLIANERVVQVAPDNVLHPGGIKYTAMVFNDTIPGPAIAVDQGDTLEITLINKGKVIHSLDFHAGLGPSQALSGIVKPGESKTWTLKAVKAGAFLYHCGGDALNGVWEHIANGMYGGIIVHPSKENQAKEFYVVFGEIYNNVDKGMYIGTNGTTGFLDMNKLLADNPDLILTNGMSHKYIRSIGKAFPISLNPNAETFKVKPGEQTRWYIINAGPNDSVAFHFIANMINVHDGSVNDNYGTQLRNDETWVIPPGSGSVIETVFPEEGVYVAADHNMSHMLKGGAFEVLSTNNSTDNDHPQGTWVPPRGSQMVSGPSFVSVVNTISTAGNQMYETPIVTSGNKVSIVLNAANLGDKSYKPNPLHVEVGDTVTWINDDTLPHTVTYGNPSNPSEKPLFDSLIIGPKKTFRYTFDKVGEFPYYCAIHPTMTGTIIVEK